MFTRRQLLKGLGLGAGMAAFAPILRHVAAAETNTLPRRFVFVVHGNGMDPGVLAPTLVKQRINAISGKDVGSRLFFHDLYTNPTVEEITQSNLSTGSAMSALATHNVEGKAALLLGLSNTIAGGGHSASFGALSCSRSRGPSPVMQTIDSYLAEQPLIRGGQAMPGASTCEEDGRTPFAAFRLGVSANTSQRVANVTCAHGKDRIAPVLTTPSGAYQALFGSLGSETDRELFRQHGRLLDFARKDASIARDTFAGSSHERLKVEAYIHAIEELECRRNTLSTPFWNDNLAMALAQTNLQSASTDARYGSDDALTQFDMQVDIATAALLGHLTNVVVLTAATTEAGLGVRYDSLGIPNLDDRHGISHAAEGGDAASIEILRRVTEGHVDMIARMASTLDGVPEGNGTMLDHTCIVYMPDNGEKHHASGEEWPILMLGGEALGLNTKGQTLIYPKHGSANFRQLSNLFNTLCWAGGDPRDDFGGEGDDVNNARGRLEELLPTPV